MQKINCNKMNKYSLNIQKNNICKISFNTNVQHSLFQLFSTNVYGIGVPSNFRFLFRGVCF